MITHLSIGMNDKYKLNGIAKTTLNNIYIQEFLIKEIVKKKIERNIEP